MQTRHYPSTDLDVFGPQLQFGRFVFLVIDESHFWEPLWFPSFKIFFQIILFILPPKHGFHRLSVGVVNSRIRLSPCRSVGLLVIFMTWLLVIFMMWLLDIFTIWLLDIFMTWLLVIFTMWLLVILRCCNVLFFMG